MQNQFTFCKQEIGLVPWGMNLKSAYLFHVPKNHEHVVIITIPGLNVFNALLRATQGLFIGDVF